MTDAAGTDDPGTNGAGTDDAGQERLAADGAVSAGANVDGPGETARLEGVRIEVEHARRVNFALHQNRVPVVARLSLTWEGEGALEDARVRLSLGNGEAEPWEARVSRVGPGETFNLEPRGPTLDGAALAGRTERERTTLVTEVEALVAGEARRAVRRDEIDLLPFDQWGGLSPCPELLAAFVTPNHPALAPVLRSARDVLRDAGERDAIDGYQSGSRARAALLAQGCFEALARLDIGYIHPPASFERQGQRVRLADRVLSERLGTCLDLSLLLAGLWEQSGLNPVVVLLDGHALPAVWTTDEHFAEPCVEEPGRVRKGVELGELVAVESTVLTQPGGTFARAVEAARQKLEGADWACALDVGTARRLGVRPLPLRVEADRTAIALEEAAGGGGIFVPASLPAVEVAERAAASGSEAPERLEDRVDRWKRRLLDLSLRNRLLNFRETKRSVELAAPDIAALEDRLAQGESLDILPRGDRRGQEGQAEAAAEREFLLSELAAGRVQTTLSEGETARRLLEIWRAAKSSIEETGANVLYLALGTLCWREAPGSDVVRRAPLALVPVSLVRKSAGGGYRYRLELSNEPGRANITLVEKLRTDFGFRMQGLEELPEDESGIDVPLLLHRFREAVRDAQGWEVEPTAHLGLFSFNKFLMWRDLQELGDRVRSHRLLGRLVGKAELDDEESPFPDAAALDETLAPGEPLCTRDADSSQVVAVRAASLGRTFVLEGPPGTGKSQTIANMIADALANGKRVLFVAEKMAALSVVRRRLEQDGLGRFCLELHSARASKKEVLRQLGEALDGAREGEPREWARSCEELAAVRGRLNEYVRELHETRASGESVYQMIGRLSALGEGARVDLSVERYGDVGDARLAEWRATVGELQTSADPVAPPGEHPLRGVGRSAWSFGLPEEAGRAIAGATSALEALWKAVSGLTEALGAADAAELTHAEVRAAVRAGLMLGSRPPLEPALLDAAADGATAERLRAWIERGRDADRRERELLQRFRPELLEADLLGMLDELRSALQKPGIVRWWFVGKARKRVRPYCVGSAPDAPSLVEALEEAGSLKRERRELTDERCEGLRWFGSAWRAGDWDGLRAQLDWAAGFQEALRGLGTTEAGAAARQGFLRAGGEGSARPAQRGAAAGKAWDAWSRAWEPLRGLLNVDETPAWGGDLQPGWMGRAAEALERWAAHLPTLNDWCAWRRARERAVGVGLTALVEAFERGSVGLEELGEVFERSFGERWLVEAADSSEALRGFNARAHAGAIERFRELDRATIAMASGVVSAKLAARLPGPSGAVSSASEVGILRRELEKRARHMPTRRLIESLPNLLPRLKPCFLMSPLSVAQYLDASHPPFNLVIFDEASQIPVWDSIGAIARGSDVVVVGDSRQLPPTNFFSTMEGEDEEAVAVADAELESILQECNASAVPALRLKWHYRSRHESLIAFSNHHYYGDELHTFPSPAAHSPELGVSFRLVEGAVYDRGGSRTNQAEAAAVVEEVVRRLREPGATGSIGIVTFNAPQQGLIEDLLDKARRDDPELERFFTGVEEPVFVKNLENVQGDERDTIVFSVGYGPDESGRVSMNFGPLNAEGGERRLNVAVTRARERLLVFCSMQPDQIDLSRTRAVGVRHFRRFLAYAQRGPAAMAEASAAHIEAGTPSELEVSVRRALEARGWTVDARVGMAGYRVDLGVRDPEREGAYLLGVECDGPMYRRASTARDRDRTRDSVLRALGWRLARVWSTAWRLDPEGCLRQIEEAIEAARAGREPAPAAEIEAKEPNGELFRRRSAEDRAEADGLTEEARDSEPLADAAIVEAPDQQTVDAQTPHSPQTYQTATRPRGLTSRSDFFSAGTTELAVRGLAAIVEQEGPIVPELAMRRLADWFGVARVTDRCRTRFEDIVAAALAERLIVREGDALWAAGAEPGSFDRFRVAGGGDGAERDAEWIPLVERAAAVRAALRAQIALPREELQREAARLLGFSRVTAKAREAMDDAVQALCDAGEAAESEGRVALPG